MVFYVLVSVYGKSIGMLKSYVSRMWCAVAMSVVCAASGVVAPAHAIADDAASPMPVSDIVEDTVVPFDEADVAPPADVSPLQHGRDMVDTDHDGFPDEWELHGFTTEDGVEIPLHMWGADPNVPDVFLQLNWMAPGDGRSYAPHKQSLNDLVELFADHGIRLHIDAGDYYTNIPQYPKRYGGQSVPYMKNMAQYNVNERDLMRDLGKGLGDRQGVFRVGLIMHGIDGSGKTGVAQYKGNAFLISKTDHISEKFMRNTILHEMGHLFGLSHHGADPRTDLEARGEFYPNYRSVMNYLYQYFIFDYTSTPSVSSSPLPLICLNPWTKCYAGEYTVVSDWDNLSLRTGDVGNLVAATGVSGNHTAASAVGPTDTTSQPYTSSEKVSEYGAKILAIVGTMVAATGFASAAIVRDAYTRGKLNHVIDLWGVPVPKVAA